MKTYQKFHCLLLKILLCVREGGNKSYLYESLNTILLSQFVVSCFQNAKNNSLMYSFLKDSKGFITLKIFTLCLVKKFMISIFKYRC